MPYEDYATIARFYDGDYDHFRTPSGDVPFYVEEAKRSGGPVLEFGCGTGRVLIPTARAGVAITGVDASPAMLERLREKMPEADVHVGDMRDFDARRRFPLVTIPFRAIGHVMEAEDHVRLFANMRRHLADGGRLVFDFFDPDPKYLAAPPGERLDFEREEAGRTIRRYSRAVRHLATQVTDVTFRWEVTDAGGGVERAETAFRMRWFHRFELEHALARAGLAVEALHGSFDRSPPDDTPRELIFVARAA